MKVSDAVSPIFGEPTFVNQTYANQTYANQTYANQTYANQTIIDTLLIGFPLVLILARVFQLSADRIKITSDSDGPLVTATAVVLLGLRPHLCAATERCVA